MQYKSAQKSKVKTQEEHRPRERQRREDEYRRRLERLRQQIVEARKRRQRMLLLLLLAVVAMQKLILSAFTRSFTYRPDPITDPADWTPDPSNDYAPAPGSNDYCDGYSYEQWTRMTAERGIQMSRKAELREAWHTDPGREDFPLRYREWGYKPFLTEIMNDLTQQRYQPDALIGLKLLSPPEVHRYLDEVYAINPTNLLHCRADLSANIVRNFQSRAVVWEEHKRQQAEEAKREKDLSRKCDGDEGTPKPK